MDEIKVDVIIPSATNVEVNADIHVSGDVTFDGTITFGNTDTDSGIVLTGPARRNLDWLPVRVLPNGDVEVNFGGSA